ncbi:beta strand repeat-containing protein [Deinococcus radiotolerans]|uniref:Bacterial Ig-like domain-containing protein n=1 Tax=Deinococcus radiotolerans TaxID=1309407 RepID=A0ABQ2FLR6_9DEIO|nr:Ig-like domain-containing protein [Deinococcus radiotolerans]GGL08713.1 hypothetical protein GCM10010844_29330 [Deinococcus radiotolerans]
MSHTTRTRRRPRYLTLLSALLIGGASTGLAATTNFTSSSPWTTVLIGAQYDSPNDRQANGGPDLLGDATHGLLYLNYDNKGTATDADDVVAYRVRLDGTSTSFADVVYMGVDANADGVVDAFIGVSNQSSSGIRIWDTGTGLNTAPSNTTVSINTTFTETATNYYYAPVSATSDPNWTSADMDADGATDYFLNFSLNFTDLKTYFATKGITINTSTALRYAVVSSTQSNAFNSDIGGVNDKQLGKAAGDTTWNSIFSPAVSPNGITVSSVSTGTAVEGAPVVHQIALAGQNGLNDTTLTVTLTAGTATLGTDTSGAQYSLDGGTNWVTAIGNGPSYAITLPKGAVIPSNTVLFRVLTVRDNLYAEGSETYTVTASTPTTLTAPTAVTGTITNFIPVVNSVADTSGTEGTNLTHTVTLANAATTGPTTVDLVLTGGTATIGTDTGTVEYSTDSGVNWTTTVPGAGGTFAVSLPANIKTFQVRIAATTDTSTEGSETYRLTASVAGGASTFGTGTINDPALAPTVTISAPDNTNTRTPTITGTTTAPSGSTVTVTVTQGATSFNLTTTVQSGGTYSVTVPNANALADGAYTAAASVTTAGGTGTASDPGSVDATPPAITITAPDNTSDTTPTITGTTDTPVGSPITVTVTQGATSFTLTTTVQTDGTFSVTVPNGSVLMDGPYSVTASTTDTAGNTGTALDAGSVDVTAPVITVAAPDNTNDTTPTITGTTDAPVGSTITVTVTQGATTLTLTTTVQIGGTFTVTIPDADALADGPYSVTASTTDTAGNTGTATDAGSVDATAPSITVSAPDNTNDTTPTITGTTDAPVGSSITVIVTQGATTLTLTTTVETGGTFSVTIPDANALVAGPYSVTASITDTNGNTSTAGDVGSVNVTVSDPVVLVDKFVRNVTVNGAFGAVADGLPGDILQYCVQFVNSGGPASAFKLTDTLPSAVRDVTHLTYSASTAPVVGASSAPASGDLPAGVTLSVVNGTVVLDFGNAVLPSGSGGTICFEVTLR